MSVKTNFTMNDIESQIVDDLKNMKKSMLDSFKLAAQEAVIKAKRKRTYKNHTYNLRSSIGYVIFQDGKELAEYFGETSNTEGREKGLRVARSKPEIYNRPGIVIIIVAGMDYARYVESKGCDVLSGSVRKFSRELQQCLEEVIDKHR